MNFMLYRRVHRERDVCNDFINLEIYRSKLNPMKVLIGV
jgi:hypothetical protein